MSKIDIFSDEQVLRVTAPCGSSVELNKETDRVYVDEDIPYSVFNKLVKELKRERNKESFSVGYFEEDN